jgi:hypothetical protein
MKRVLFALLVLIGTVAAQTTTYTGTVRDLSGALTGIPGAPVTSGNVTFTQLPSVDSTISGVSRFVPLVITCGLDGTGALKAQDLVSPCIVTQNTALTPSGTSYKICIQPYFTTPGSCFVDYATVSTKDISTVAPTPQLSPSYPVSSAFFSTPNTWTAAQTDSALHTFNAGIKSSDTTLGGPVIDARYYGLVGDGATDNTANFNTLTAAACTAGSRSILFPAGIYFFASKPNAIGCGLIILGQGSGSAPNHNGTGLIANYDESTATNGFITFNGNFSTVSGTGCGLENIGIFKATGHTGGVGWKLTGSDDNHRAGFCHTRSVQIGSYIAGGTFNYGIYVDGSNNVTSGSEGIRDVTLIDTWVNSATTKTVWLDNATHLHWYGGAVYGGSSGSAGITVTGQGTAGSATQNSTDIILDMTVFGDLTIDKANNVFFSGFVLGGNVSVTSNTTKSRVSGFTDGTVTNSSATSVADLGTGENSLRVDKICVGWSYTPCGATAGDIKIARDATTAFLWLGSDSFGYFGRTASAVAGIGGGNLSTFQINHASAMLELSTDTGLSRGAAGQVNVGNGTTGDASGTLRAAGFVGSGSPRIATGSASNTDPAGKLTLVAGTATYTFTNTYLTAPICISKDITTSTNATNETVTTTTLTLTGTGTDQLKYICVGLN